VALLNDNVTEVINITGTTSPVVNIYDQINLQMDKTITGDDRVNWNNISFPGAGVTFYAQWVPTTPVADVINFLQASGDGTMTLLHYPDTGYSIQINQNIVLGGNKTLITGTNNSGWIHILLSGNITGNYTLTLERGAIGVNGLVDCNITLNNATFGNWSGNLKTVLASGRTINATNGTLGVNDTFENNGTINANGGAFTYWWPPRTTVVIAAPSGSTFNLLNLESQVWVQRDQTNSKWFWLTGWSTTATGNDKIDMSLTSFDGAGKTLYAQWEDYSFEVITERWDIPDEVLSDLIAEAEAGNGLVEIDMTDNQSAGAAELPMSSLTTISDAGLGYHSIWSPTKSSIPPQTAAVAVAADQAERRRQATTVR